MQRVQPSAYSYSVGVPKEGGFAALYPARKCHCQRFDAALAGGSAYSGPVWVASPSPYDSFIHDTSPVYPGAQKFRQVMPAMTESTFQLK
jgi:hypothetical protein